MRNIMCVAILCLIFSCNEDDPKQEVVYEIEPSFTTQVDAFYSEAQARGKGTFSHDNLIVRELEPGFQLPNGTHPVSRYYEDGNQRIIEIQIIDPSACQEIPVFREMAHVFLNKPYKDDDSNTIMDIDTNPCIYVHLPSGQFYPTREGDLLPFLGQC